MWWGAYSGREWALPHSPLGLSEARPTCQGKSVPMRWRTSAGRVHTRSELAGTVCRGPHPGCAPTVISDGREPVQRGHDQSASQ